jgi:hypothetical protein
LSLERHPHGDKRSEPIRCFSGDEPAFTTKRWRGNERTALEVVAP